jgi:hypothetical protein
MVFGDTAGPSRSHWPSEFAVDVCDPFTKKAEISKNDNLSEWRQM